MSRLYLRPYGAQAIINFELFEIDGVDLRTDAAHAAGDTKISKDEGAEAPTANGFVDNGQGYSLTLSAAELTAARVVIYVVDQDATKVWLDSALIVETYGNASAMHPNFGVAMRGTDSGALASVCTEARLAELDPGNLPSDIDGLTSGMARLLGLSYENAYQHTRVYSGTLLQSAKVDLYDSKANATTHNGVLGIVAKYTLTFTYSGNNLATMQVVRDS